MFQRLGKFEILRILGKGGMGEVYLARDPILDREVAIKTIRFGGEDPERDIKRFVREAQVAARLSHPNIVTIYEFGEDQGTHYLAMEYVPGSDLDALLNAKSLPLHAGLDLMAQVCDGLAVAHRSGVIHRDIKPANIRVAQLHDHLVAKIVDFGLARQELNSTLTATGMLFGTSAYLSPELLRGAEASHHQDLWAIGVTLYQVLTGKRPFEGATNASVHFKIVFEEFPPILDLDHPILTARAQELMQRILAKEASLRLQTAEEMAAAVRSLLTHTEFRPFSLDLGAIGKPGPSLISCSPHTPLASIPPSLPSLPGAPSTHLERFFVQPTQSLSSPKATDPETLYTQGLEFLGSDPDQAMKCFRAAAQEGHLESKVQLAKQLLPSDPRQAEQLLEQASSAGAEEASVLLAECWLDANRPQEAQTLLIRTAHRGSAEAVQGLLKLYPDGNFPDVDPEEAEQWLRWAAALNHPQALLCMGRKLGDTDEGLDCLKKAGEFGHFEALLEAGERAERMGKPEVAVEMYRVGSWKGLSEAMYRLGLLMLEGRGTAPDARGAARQLYQAAQVGHLEARCLFGTLLLEGRGVTQDCRSGIDWLRGAAQEGYGPAMMELGRALRVAGNGPEALEWLDRAVALKLPGARTELALVFKEGQGLAKDPVRACEHLLKAAEEGEASAMLELGKCLVAGEGIARNQAHALRWLTCAAEAGLPEAMFLAAQMLEQGRGARANPEAARRLYQMAAEAGWTSV